MAPDGMIRALYCNMEISGKLVRSCPPRMWMDSEVRPAPPLYFNMLLMDCAENGLPLLLT